jgi:hypothetical protein
MPSTSSSFLVRRREALRRLGRARSIRHPGGALARSSAALASSTFAGVAQLVERQLSKLNVEGSNPFSRSVLFSGSRAPQPANFQVVEVSVTGSRAPQPANFQVVEVSVTDSRAPQPANFRVAGFSRSGLRASRAMSFESVPASSRSLGSLFAVCGGPIPQADAGGRVSEAFLPRVCSVRRGSYSAHLAQLVEHVLGKDEVTSSILVVGSKRTRDMAVGSLELTSLLHPGCSLTEGPGKAGPQTSRPSHRLRNACGGSHVTYGSHN